MSLAEYQAELEQERRETLARRRRDAVLKTVWDYAVATAIGAPFLIVMWKWALS